MAWLSKFGIYEVLFFDWVFQAHGWRYWWWLCLAPSPQFVLKNWFYPDSLRRFDGLRIEHDQIWVFNHDQMNELGSVNDYEIQSLMAVSSAAISPGALVSMRHVFVTIRRFRPGLSPLQLRYVARLQQHHALLGRIVFW